MILTIQYLRGIAALLVLLHHVAWKNEQHGENLLGWLRIGEVGVDIFFVVSGFVMCHATRDSSVRLGAFVRHRIIRVIPLYWVMSSIALLVFLVKPGLVNSSGGETGVVASFLLLPLPEGGKYLVQVGWTLAYEVYFYLLFSVGLLLERRAGRAVVIAMLVALVALGRLDAPAGRVWAFLTSDLLLEFAAGMLLYSFFETKHAVHPLAACGLFALGAAQLIRCNEAGAISGVRAIDYGIAAVLIVAGAVLLEPRVGKRRLPFLEMLGDSSYSLYLSHVFVLGAFAFVLARLPRLGTLASLLLVPVMAAAAVAVAYVCWRWLERPMTRALRSAFDASAGARARRAASGHQGHPAA
jgi:peptidoglycan/LPS O-acetylase OafA/YrhL